MMTHTVESKYKNPDLYVATLKKQLDEVWGVARQRLRDYAHERNGATARVKREVDAVWGEQVNTWVGGVTAERGCNALSLGVFNPGDIVILIGRVREVRKHINKDSVIEYELLETRRRDHD